MSLIKVGRVARVLINRSVTRLYSAGEGSSTGGETSTKAPAEPAPAKPAAPAASPPEPFDNTKYKCDVYYQHNPLSFYDIEAEMAANRVGQPSSKTAPQ